MNDFEKGWISALIDGEGSLSLIKEKREHFTAGCTYKPRLNIGNNSLELLEKAREIIGAGAIINKNRKLKQLDVSANGLRYLLPKITLIVKDKQRKLLLNALHYLAQHKGKGNPRTEEEINHLEEIYVKIRNLNGSVWNK